MFIHAILDWLKKYWKWLLFPVGISMAAASYVAGKLASSRPTAPTILNPDAAQNLLDQVVESQAKRDAMLEELKAEHADRLVNISEEQQKEMEELRHKNLEEVVAWFDQL